MNPDPVDYDSAINPNTFEVDITLEIACDDEDQIVSRPVGEGYTYKDLEGSRVRFASQEYELGAVPAEDDEHSDGDLTTFGWCQSVELYLSAKNFGGETIALGMYRSEQQLEAAKAAIIASINP